MRKVALAPLSLVVSKVWRPMEENDIFNYRRLPTLPYVFIDETARYCIFATD